MFTKIFKKPYIFTLKKPERLDTHINLVGKLPKPTISFGDRGWWLMVNEKGVLIVNEKYSWDGCSPKIKLLGKVIGVYDGPVRPADGADQLKAWKNGVCVQRPVTWRASLFHDALCQFQKHPDMPFSREQIDLIFLKIMELDGFEHAKLYYRVVRLFGGVYTSLTGWASGRAK